LSRSVASLGGLSVYVGADEGFGFILIGGGERGVGDAAAGGAGGVGLGVGAVDAAGAVGAVENVGVGAAQERGGIGGERGEEIGGGGALDDHRIVGGAIHRERCARLDAEESGVPDL